MKYRILVLLAACLFGICGFAAAQQNLDRRVSVNVRNKKISDLLTTIGKQGGFYFSYTTNWVAVDSVVTVSENNKPIRELLDQVFSGKVDYKEAPGYIILRPAPYRLAVFPDNDAAPDNTYLITGYVTDERTGARLSGASVFEPHVLISTLTDRSGYFKLKVKYSGPVTLTVTKEMYKDTSVNIIGSVTVVSNKNFYYSADTTYRRMEKSWLGRMFVSSRQKLQSLNIGNYIADVPVQSSITPGLSSHGMMSSQIVNKASLNLLGGYTAGVNGVELAGVFNINRLDVKYVQAAGVFNLTSGKVSGVQLSGLANTVFKSVEGVQAAGLYNVAKDSLIGVQMAGLSNYAGTNAKGAQAAGLINLVEGESRAIQMAGLINKNCQNSVGIQTAGLANITHGEAKGVQVAGAFNYAHKLNGLHISFLNIADTLNGVTIGLLNIARNGYRQVAIYTDETEPLNLSFKSGNHKLYTRIFAGYHPGDTYTWYSYGAGLGHDFIAKPKSQLAVEGSFQTLQSGKFKNQHYLSKLSLFYHHSIASGFGVFGGPSFTLYHSPGQWRPQEDIGIADHQLLAGDLSDRAKAWLGWTVGVTLF